MALSFIKKDYMNNVEKGSFGEKLVEEYMIKNNYKIIDKNCRLGKKEIDIIATKENIIIFVEVKLRNSKSFGHGFDALSRNKKKNIIKAAGDYLLSHSYGNYNVRFDVASIDEGKLSYIENAFDLNY